jgi:hypothetical protein
MENNTHFIGGRGWGKTATMKAETDLLVEFTRCSKLIELHAHMMLTPNPIKFFYHLIKIRKYGKIADETKKKLDGIRFAIYKTDGGDMCPCNLIEIETEGEAN